LWIQGKWEGVAIQGKEKEAEVSKRNSTCSARKNAQQTERGKSVIIRESAEGGGGHKVKVNNQGDRKEHGTKEEY